MYRVCSSPKTGLDSPRHENQKSNRNRTITECSLFTKNTILISLLNFVLQLFFFDTLVLNVCF